MTVVRPLKISLNRFSCSSWLNSAGWKWKWVKKRGSNISSAWISGNYSSPWISGTSWRCWGWWSNTALCVEFWRKENSRGKAVLWLNCWLWELGYRLQRLASKVEFLPRFFCWVFQQTKKNYFNVFCFFLPLETNQILICFHFFASSQNLFGSMMVSSKTLDYKECRHDSRYVFLPASQKLEIIEVDLTKISWRRPFKLVYL